MQQLGKTLIYFGLLLIIAGAVLMLAGKFSIPFGRLPGDITYHGKKVTVFAPFGTMIVVSIVLSLILHFLSRFK